MKKDTALCRKILKPLSGEICFNGTPLSAIRRRDYAREVSAVHQYNTVPDDMTVRRLVSMGRTAYHNMFFAHETDEDREAIERAMNETHTAEFAERRVKELSGGQMQRVCIARALAGGAKLILADEPTGNLDSVSGSAVIDVFRKLAEEGVTIVMVTHNKQFAARCDRIIELKDGRVQ